MNLILENCLEVHVCVYLLGEWGILEHDPTWDTLLPVLMRINSFTHTGRPKNERHFWILNNLKTVKDRKSQYDASLFEKQ